MLMLMLMLFSKVVLLLFTVRFRKEGHLWIRDET